MRLTPDQRREQLLDTAVQLAAGADVGAVSVQRIAVAAGVSEGLLYHYFPSKRAFFQATLALAAEELRVLTEPDPSLDRVAALRASLDAYLAWIESHRTAYVKLIESATGHGEVRDLIVEIRDTTAARILDTLSPGSPAPGRMRAAVRAWLWFMDGAATDWVEHGDYTRPELLEVLLGALTGALRAAAS